MPLTSDAQHNSSAQTTTALEQIVRRMLKCGHQNSKTNHEIDFKNHEIHEILFNSSSPNLWLCCCFDIMFASLRLTLAGQPMVAGKPIKLKNPNAGFFKAAFPFLAFCVAGSYFVSRFQSERLYMTDKQRNSMSMAEAKRREEEVEAELERIQKYVLLLFHLSHICSLII
jgi:hypothetical protein